MIETVKPESPYYDQVVELCDANRSTLGFFPRGAIHDAAADGRVLASVENLRVRGYALYRTRVRTNDVSLTHLCVAEEYRGLGIARKLVDHIAEQRSHSNGIRVLCRKDYSAHHMWPKLDFEPRGEKPGRGHDRLPLVIWWRQITVTLFDVDLDILDNRIVAALDTNVMIDILDQREYDESLALTADWVEEAAELVVTEQLHHELLDNYRQSRYYKTILAEYRKLDTRLEKEQAILARLKNGLNTTSGNGDLQLVAEAVAGDASYLISRDDGLQQIADDIKRLTGLTVVNPADFLLQLHRQGNEHEYQPRVVAGSELCIVPADSIPPRSRLGALCYHNIRERPIQLERCLKEVAARQSHRIQQLLDNSGSILALSALYCEDEKIFVKLLRSSQSQDCYTLIRQMVHDIRRSAAEDSRTQIIITDNISTPGSAIAGNPTKRSSHPMSSTTQAIIDEGFMLCGESWSADVRHDVITPDDCLPAELNRISRSELTPYHIRQYELRFWPSKVFCGVVPAYIVPIKPEYARVLLGYQENQARLFEDHPLAALARENVYYKYPRDLESPARILWWVSDGGETGGMRAVSWLDEVDTGDPNRLYRKYRNRGVLKEEDVKKCASTASDSGQRVTALLFSQTTIFPQPVPMDVTKQIFTEKGHSPSWISVQNINEDIVASFFNEAFKHGL